MQANYKKSLSEKELFETIREVEKIERGFGEGVIPFNEKKMKKALGVKGVESINVFKPNGIYGDRRAQNKKKFFTNRTRKR